MKLRPILFYNLTGAALVLSWWLPSLLFWTSLDDDVFFFFNQFITPLYPHWTELMALLNTRAFDQVLFVIMLVLLFMAMRLDRQGSWHKWLAISVVMAIVAALLGSLLHDHLLLARPSPTLWFPQANHLSSLTTLPAKDTASDSFPSDHGLMAMIFASFMLRFAVRRIALTAVLMTVIATAPRIMVGAPWVSDVYMGSLAMALVILPWLLCTPVINGLVGPLDRALVLLQQRVISRPRH
ncbi:phosphatase PAP2 family protein [Kushneria phosphatilytica]|uniref:phosphatase PAP2 family protein n=1 Tax=Kushneria phosphatilytica TaxID=657387 RepID=UPI0008DAE330|nr:phosphatase PAP2 family protein [Kushneria phosphatilytica]OHV07725.1 hypothetical protein BH688_16210 [Kushneria phosphatilytica]